VATPSGFHKESRLVEGAAVRAGIPHSFQFVKFVLEVFQLTSGSATTSPGTGP